MALNVLRTLSEEIFVYKDEDMDEKRHKDLVESLNATMKLVMPILRRFITEKLALRDKLTESKDTNASVYENLVIAALKLLSSLSEWIDYRYMIKLSESPLGIIMTLI